MSAARIDHVILGVADLEAAASRLLDDHGLASVAGGRHMGFGTANRIVPLGRDYVELVAAADDTEARGNAFGRKVLDAAGRGGGLVGWCVGVEHVDGVALRLGVTADEGSRVRPDGVTLRWRMCGLEPALSEPWKPFFIEWRIPPEAHPGRGTVAHRTKPLGIAWVEVAADPQLLEEWLGETAVDVRFAEGLPPLRRVGIATGDGEVVLGESGRGVALPTSHP